MDRFGYSATSLDELKQIQNEVSAAHSLRHLRGYFDRVQELKRIHSGNFDVQLLVAETQDAIIERARDLRSRGGLAHAEDDFFEEPSHAAGAAPAYEDVPPIRAERAVSEEPRRNWRLATLLALALTGVICIVFFFLIQWARRTNFPNENTPAPKTAQPAGGAAQTAKSPGPATPVSTSPTVRLYTDLIPGTVSIDDGDPQDLKDGELVLDHLEPGQHSIKVNGKSGSAEFGFEVAQGAAPQPVPPLTANNALAVLVSTQDGKGRLLASAPDASIAVDGKPLGTAGANGLELSALGTTDHDLEVTQDNDKQRFVMTYTPAPALTVYIKSVLSLGTVTVMTHQDGVNVYIQDKLYRRKTDRGQIRIPLKVGTYSIRVHKDGFIDPPAQTADVKKGDEIKLDFNLEPVPTVSSLAISGAMPGTSVYVDGSPLGTINAEGQATLANLKPGEHSIELRAEGYLPKRFVRVFQAGSTVTLVGPDTTLQRVVSEPKAAPPPPPPPADTSAPAKPVEIPGEQVRRGPGFVHYNVPRAAGHYSFEAHSKIGGVFRHDKLQWYAGYQDSSNYVLFSVDGRHASVRKVTDGHSEEISRIPFTANSDGWVQVEMTVTPDHISARVRKPGEAWSSIGSVASSGSDFTQGRVGFFLPGNDEVAVANFRFSAK
ncbi:MAG TPA: PEGA domain-containing protein [Bryobacteraceae bacterium]|nr:PEGA domain-containing protein [Bryobacteraceae bacterium]